jgi:magnesium-protoporphyrin O-methyltransferase
MLSPDFGRFDHVVAMDSLIHYAPADVVRSVATLAERARGSVLFTYAPRTPALTVMHTVGKLFPRGDRSPRIVPVGRDDLISRLVAEPALADWREVRFERIKSGFYQSCAQEMVRR